MRQHNFKLIIDRARVNERKNRHEKDHNWYSWECRFVVLKHVFMYKRDIYVANQEMQHKTYPYQKPLRVNIDWIIIKRLRTTTKSLHLRYSI